MRSTATAERRLGLTGSTQLIVHMDAFNRAATCVCVCVCGVCLHFWDAALDSWVTVSQCYLPDCFSMFGIKAVFSLS